MPSEKTIREIELEQRVFRLERLLFEATMKAGLMPNQIGVGRKIFDQGPDILRPAIPMMTYATCDFEADPMTGWKVTVIGHPHGRAWHYQHQYRVSEPWLIPDEAMPDILSEEHTRFQHALIKHLRLGKRAA